MHSSPETHMNRNVAWINGSHHSNKKKTKKQKNCPNWKQNPWISIAIRWHVRTHTTDRNKKICWKQLHSVGSRKRPTRLDSSKLTTTKTTTTKTQMPVSKNESLIHRCRCRPQSRDGRWAHSRMTMHTAIAYCTSLNDIRQKAENSGSSSEKKKQTRDSMSARRHDANLFFSRVKKKTQKSTEHK